MSAVGAKELSRGWSEAKPTEKHPKRAEPRSGGRNRNWDSAAFLPPLRGSITGGHRPVGFACRFAAALHPRLSSYAASRLFPAQQPII